MRNRPTLVFLLLSPSIGGLFRGGFGYRLQHRLVYRFIPNLKDRVPLASNSLVLENEALEVTPMIFIGAFIFPIVISECPPKH